MLGVLGQLFKVGKALPHQSIDHQQRLFTEPEERKQLLRLRLIWPPSVLTDFKSFGRDARADTQGAWPPPQLTDGDQSFVSLSENEIYGVDSFNVTTR